MDEEKGSPGHESGRDPDQPGRLLIPQLREHRGFLLSIFALALFAGIVFIAVRPLSGRTPTGTLASSPSPSEASSPSPPGSPFLGLYPGLAYDPAHHQVVLFNRLGETWLWSGNRWTVAHPRVSPRGRESAAMAWDPKLEEVLLFGGWVGPDDLPRDTWAWNGSTWREVGHGAVAPPGGAAGLAYDPGRQQMVLLVFAGFGPIAPTETWTWDGAHWQQRPQRDGPAGPLFPIAFDPRSRTVLVAGERCTALGCEPETWSWDGSSWHRLVPAHEPSASAHMTLVSDPVLGQPLMLTEADVPHGAPFPTETWTWDGRDWSRLQSVGQPGGTVNAVGTSDGSRGTVWAFEDVTPSVGATRVDAAWSWTGTKWVQSVGAAPSPSLIAPSLPPCEVVPNRIVTPVGNNPAAQGVLGPLYVNAGQFAPGRPTKVVLQLGHTASPVGPFTMSGDRCSDHHPLYFAYRNGDLPPATTAQAQPVSAAQLESWGRTVETLPASVSGQGGYTGYMLFTSPGVWLVQLSSGTQVVGQLVLDVRM
jgi:hypothetical protein